MRQPPRNDRCFDSKAQYNGAHAGASQPGRRVLGSGRPVRLHPPQINGSTGKVIDHWVRLTDHRRWQHARRRRGQ
jgi:hypothetical protein